MTTLIYRGFPVTKTIAPATDAPKSLIYRGTAHTGPDAIETPRAKDLVYRSVAFTKLTSGRIVLDKVQPAGLPGVAASA